MVRSRWCLRSSPSRVDLRSAFAVLGPRRGGWSTSGSQRTVCFAFGFNRRGGIAPSFCPLCGLWCRLTERPASIVPRRQVISTVFGIAAAAGPTASRALPNINGHPGRTQGVSVRVTCDLAHAAVPNDSALVLSTSISRVATKVS